MTMLYSCASKDRIITAVDSAEVREYSSGEKEYVICSKSKFFENIGYVGTWGARDHNRIFEFLDKKINTCSDVDDLANIVNKYLTKHYKPHEMGLGSVGYHVAGFNSKKESRLYNIFWGFDAPRPPDQTERKYGKNDHSPAIGATSFLYNGRNDIAHFIIQVFLGELQKNQSSRLDINNPVDLVKLADLITRFACEITYDVSPPFYIYVISPENRIENIKNVNLSPLTGDAINEKIKTLAERR